jgi:hypothetical protein
MDRKQAVALLDALHQAQNEFYAGGPDTALRRLLSPGVTWSVPGDNRIAGSYRGIEEVFVYFQRRRDLADRSFRLIRLDVLVGEGGCVAALTDGSATIAGIARQWSTVGLYRLHGGQVAACWLLPLDQDEFDRIWSA